MYERSGTQLLRATNEIKLGLDTSEKLTSVMTFLTNLGVASLILSNFKFILVGKADRQSLRLEF